MPLIIIFLVIALGVVTTLLILNNRNNSEQPSNTPKIEVDPNAKNWAETELRIRAEKQRAYGKTYLAPTDNATRAEFASIIMRFVQNIAEP